MAVNLSANTAFAISACISEKGSFVNARLFVDTDKKGDNNFSTRDSEQGFAAFEKPNAFKEAVIACLFHE